MDAETKHEPLLVREARANQKDEVIVVHGDQWLVRGAERVAVVIGPDGHENECLAAQFAASPDLIDATRKLNALLESMQAAVTDYLQPVGGRSKDRLISLIVELQDGKEQREAQIAARAAIAKATVTP